MGGFQLHNFQRYQISPRNHLIVGQYTIVFVVVYLVFLIISLITKYPQYQLILVFGFIVACIFVVPGVLLHINYTNNNKKYLLHEYADKIVIYKSGVLFKQVDLQNLKSIQIYMAPNFILFDTGARLGCEDYNYLTFETTEGFVHITNLLYPDIKKLGHKFKEIPPRYHKTIFAKIK